MSDVRYRAGGRLRFGKRLRSARVVRLGAERDTITLPGWRTFSIEHKQYRLLVQGDVIDERALAGGRLEDLVPSLRAAEERLAGERDTKAERSLDAAMGDQAYSAILDESGALLLPTGEIAVGFCADVGEESARRTIVEAGGVVKKRLEFLKSCWLVEDPGRDGLDLALRLGEAPGVRFASPNFIEEMPPRRAARPPNDLFGEQWHLANDGQGGGVAGADVKALDAWQITRGAPEVIVCVIDSGVELSHEAFASPGKIVAPLDIADGDLLPNPTTSAHGTACAGVAVASWGTGRTVGIAPNCRLMPIRRAALSEHVRMAEAFAWAWQEGADVISCSFGHDGRPWILPDVVRASLEDTLAKGRNGRGCVVVWAAGNGDEQVSDDEWASHPGTIAVAASTNTDVRAPYSDFGPEIDVCAPSSGGSLAITTTSNGGYTSYFGGTSSAAPLVAGIAALLLSVCPGLTHQDVRAILRSSAVRIDGEGGGYDERGHSWLYGFGRVDAAAALHRISPVIEILRGSSIEGEAALIEAFAEVHLAPDANGRLLLDFLAAQRFAILELLKMDLAFRQNCLVVFQAMVRTMTEGEHDPTPSPSLLHALTEAASAVLDASRGV